ncbi:MAG: shikimate dehydrogenase [Acetivibrionales bacterium]
MVLDKRIDGRTVLTGLIGNPVEHTVSPVIHNSLFLLMGINGVYLPLKTEETGLEAAVKGLAALGFVGFNVTIPYKEAICSLLDEVDEEVRLLGTANTVKILDGRLYGYNTDGKGFVTAFRKQTGADFAGKKVCILGAGGTARTLAIKVVQEGAGQVCIINRTVSKAVEIAGYINDTLRAGSGLREPVLSLAPDTKRTIEALNESDIIINTTSVGMYPDIGASPVDEGVDFASRPIVYDVIYNPARTRLLSMAHEKGCSIYNGAGMLFYQGIRAFEIWMDTRISDDVLQKLSTSFLKHLED